MSIIFQLEDQDVNKSTIKLEEGDEQQQPQDLIATEIIQSPPTTNEVATTSALPTTVITQRHRMITAAGHIRYTILGTILVAHLPNPNPIIVDKKKGFSAT